MEYSKIPRICVQYDIYVSQLVHAHFLNVKSHKVIKAGIYELGFHLFLQLENIPAISAGEEKRKERKVRDNVVCR